MERKTKQRLLSGMRPTGSLHLGNYFGALTNWIKLQTQYECLFMIADYHALTTPFDPKTLHEKSIELAAEWIASGVNLKTATIFIQSYVPEHAELSLLLGMITPVSWLERVPTYKEKVAQFPENVNYGLFGYPVLQTADIVLYDAQVVPVGEDQLSHLELSREIVRRFNHKFNDILIEPRPLLSKTPKIMSLSHPEQKMSKSMGEESYIALADSNKEIERKIKKAVTDIGPDSKMSPGMENLFTLLELFSDKKTNQVFKDQYQNKKLKYVDLKTQLIKDTIKTIAPIREKREKLLTNKKVLKKLLITGSQKAQKIAIQKNKAIKTAMGLI